MRFSLRTLSIAFALLVSLGLITAAFVVSGTTNQANAENAEQLLRAYATKDTDADGLPDWQEKLYNTDPANAHSVDPTKTDGEAVEAGLVKPRFETEDVASTTVATVPGGKAVPNTVTDKFSRLFFEQYLNMKASGVTPTTDQLLTFIDGAVEELKKTNQIPRRYTIQDVKTVGTGPEALQAYAVAVERAFTLAPSGPGADAMTYFTKVVYKDDTKALSDLKQLGKDYDAMHKALIQVPVPRELAAIHLRFANALALMSTVISDLTTVNDDPLRAFLVLDQYNDAAKEFADTIIAYHDVYKAANVAIAPEQEGYVFYSLLTNLARTAAAAKEQQTP